MVILASDEASKAEGSDAEATVADTHHGTKTGPGILDTIDAATLAQAISRHSGGTPKRSGQGWTVRCPNPSHADNKPSCSVNDNNGAALWHCFACRAGGNAITWYRTAIGEPPDGRSITRALADELGISAAGTETGQRTAKTPAGQHTAQPDPAEPDPPEPDWAARLDNERVVGSNADTLLAKFAASRKLAGSTLHAAGVHAAGRRHLCAPGDCDAWRPDSRGDPDRESEGIWMSLPVVRVPLRDCDSAVRGWQDILPAATARHFGGPSKRTASGCRWPAVGLDRLRDRPARILIAEGVTDWLTALQAAPRWAAVAALGAERMAETACAVAIAAKQWPDSDEIRVLIAGDGDKAGRAGAKAAADELAGRGIKCARLRLPDGDDISDLLRSGAIDDDPDSGWAWQDSLNAVADKADDGSERHMPTRRRPRAAPVGVRDASASEARSIGSGPPAEVWPRRDTADGTWTVTVAVDGDGPGRHRIVAAAPLGGSGTDTPDVPDGGWIPSETMYAHRLQAAAEHAAETKHACFEWAVKIRGHQVVNVHPVRDAA